MHIHNKRHRPFFPPLALKEPAMSTKTKKTTHAQHKNTPARMLQISTALFTLTAVAGVWAADTDIYGPSTSASQAPNVLIHFDNTANWSANNNAWNPGSVYDKCKAADVGTKTPCKDVITTVFGPNKTNSLKWPWETGFSEWGNNDSPRQGQVQLRALKYVLKALVCDTPKISINVGISLFNSDKGSMRNNGDAVSVIHHAVQPLVKLPVDKCSELLGKIDTIAADINDNDYKAPADADYSAPIYEAFKYFGGFTNPNLVASSTAGSPISRTAYGAGRFGSNKTPLDDRNAFTDDTHTAYNPPSSHCSGSYLILVGNGYPKEEPNDGPLRFQGLNYTPPALSSTTSDTSRLADEWAYFAANTDTNPAAGVQPLNTYTVNVFNASKDTDQTKLLKSMASVGSPDNVYVEVGGDLLKLISEFENMFLRVATKDSIFAATTLPVATNAQGTYLNQVYVGMFRPDGDFRPRWIGNMRQYQIGRSNDQLTLMDANNKTATSGGFFASTAQSFWTESSVFFDQNPLGTPATSSDSPDGSVTEKGGAAQMLRQANLQNATARKVYTLPTTPTSNAPLLDTPFNTTHTGLSADLVNWVRGENNVASDSSVLHAESFNGSYLNGTVATLLGNTGARHSMHGDVLHSTPLAINYVGSDVVVYYGTNDGHFHAINGQKTGTGAGSELWSFVSREHYPLVDRLRKGTPLIQIPENNDLGELIPAGDKTPRTYGMDGPIGSYVRYTGSTLSEAIIYPSMRRGGRSVYALDVTEKNNPKFKWKITGGGTGDFAKLGQTWSMPRTIAIDNAVTPNIITIMGGGYDPAEDSNTSASIGNAVFIINGRTGAIIKRIDTDFSVPSEITVVDTNRDGRIDRLYFADVRGNLYRINVPASGALETAATWNTVTATKIAALEGKVFYRPDVLVTKNFVAIMVGTGDREKPTMRVTSDRFFLIKDPISTPLSRTLAIADLTKIATVNNATMKAVPEIGATTNANGCYIQLATNGEKVINAPLTASGVTYFGTNRPAPANTNSCVGDLGQGFSYEFPLFCQPTIKTTEILGGGMIPTPVGGVVLMESTNDQGETVQYKQPFLIGSGSSPLNVIDPKPFTSPKRRPIYWRINNNNR
jgi:type IV pilus assembly protein PilY1